ncbi:hypothetical protein MP228_009674 [Amoeboaphelidium protococcarum]|nr:hypothetical protein MP228_009674 [Amoeboaphelidium protococcarum]
MMELKQLKARAYPVDLQLMALLLRVKNGCLLSKVLFFEYIKDFRTIELSKVFKDQPSKVDFLYEYWLAFKETPSHDIKCYVNFTDLTGLLPKLPLSVIAELLSRDDFVYERERLQLLNVLEYGYGIASGRNSAQIFWSELSSTLFQQLKKSNEHQKNAVVSSYSAILNRLSVLGFTQLQTKPFEILELIQRRNRCFSRTEAIHLVQELLALIAHYYCVSGQSLVFNTNREELLQFLTEMWPIVINAVSAVVEKYGVNGNNYLDIIRKEIDSLAKRYGSWQNQMFASKLRMGFR